MPDANEINAFLNDFKAKLGIWGIVFRDDRGKNFQTLLDLDITSNYRIEVLKDLKKEDYSEGPLEEKFYNLSPMWVFGKIVKQKEIYIKITLGNAGINVICISFHIAEHAMSYPLKN